MSQPWILMCPPDHFGIEYEINPWMSRSSQADRQVAMREWSALKQILEGAGARVSLMEAVPGLPDLVFTANAAMIHRRQAVLARFRHPERQGEEIHDERWLSDNGFEVLHLPGETYFEGAGDALYSGDTLFAGYRIRSDALGHQRVGALVGCRVIPLELVDGRYYHLDTCLCPLAPGQAIFYPAAFDSYGQRVLAELIPDLIAVEKAEAERFACNAVVVGRTVVTNTGSSGLHAELKGRGYEPLETPLDEFVKAGGSAKCLTLRLDGEEAAGWKSA